MGSLMHWEILDENRIHVLSALLKSAELGEFYMAGGTALSLEMGLRKSEDFDFFVPHSFYPGDLYRQLTNLFTADNVIDDEISKGTCIAVIDGVKVSFFEYPYPTLFPYITNDEFGPLQLASPEDIAVMKAAAMGARGSRKDFFDLYQILNRTSYTVTDLACDLFVKFGINHNFSYIGMGMQYFADAESEILSHLYVPFDWDGAKKYFEGIGPQFSENIRDITVYFAAHKNAGKKFPFASYEQKHRLLKEICYHDTLP